MTEYYKKNDVIPLETQCMVRLDGGGGVAGPVVVISPDEMAATRGSRQEVHDTNRTPGRYIAGSTKAPSDIKYDTWKFKITNLRPLTAEEQKKWPEPAPEPEVLFYAAADTVSSDNARIVRWLAYKVEGDTLFIRSCRDKKWVRSSCKDAPARIACFRKSHTPCTESEALASLIAVPAEAKVRYYKAAGSQGIVCRADTDGTLWYRSRKEGWQDASSDYEDEAAMVSAVCDPETPISLVDANRILGLDVEPAPAEKPAEPKRRWFKRHCGKELKMCVPVAGQSMLYRRGRWVHESNPVSHYTDIHPDKYEELSEPDALAYLEEKGWDRPPGMDVEPAATITADVPAEKKFEIGQYLVDPNGIIARVTAIPDAERISVEYPDGKVGSGPAKLWSLWQPEVGEKAQWRPKGGAWKPDLAEVITWDDYAHANGHECVSPGDADTYTPLKYSATGWSGSNVGCQYPTDLAPASFAPEPEPVEEEEVPAPVPSLPDYDPDSVSFKAQPIPIAGGFKVGDEIEWRTGVTSPWGYPAIIISWEILAETKDIPGDTDKYVPFKQVAHIPKRETGYEYLCNVRHAQPASELEPEPVEDVVGNVGIYSQAMTAQEVDANAANTPKVSDADIIGNKSDVSTVTTPGGFLVPEKYAEQIKALFATKLNGKVNYDEIEPKITGTLVYNVKEPRAQKPGKEDAEMKNLVLPYSEKIECPACGYEHSRKWTDHYGDKLKTARNGRVEHPIQTASFAGYKTEDETLHKKCWQCGYLIRITPKAKMPIPEPTPPRLLALKGWAKVKARSLAWWAAKWASLASAAGTGLTYYIYNDRLGIETTVPEAFGLFCQYVGNAVGQMV